MISRSDLLTRGRKQERQYLRVHEEVSVGNYDVSGASRIRVCFGQESSGTNTHPNGRPMVRPPGGEIPATSSHSRPNVFPTVEPSEADGGSDSHLVPYAQMRSKQKPRIQSRSKGGNVHIAESS